MTNTEPQPGALLKAFEKHDIEGVKKLLADGADPNERNADFGTALHAAMAYGSIQYEPRTPDSPCEIVKLLVEAGADLEAVDKQGRTALMYASLYFYYSVDYFIEKGASLNATDPEGRTALDLAIEGGRTGNAETLARAIEQQARERSAREASTFHRTATARQEALKQRRLKFKGGP